MRSELTSMLVLAACLCSAAAARAQDAPAPNGDPMAEYRERFKAGLSHYQAGATGEAIQWWEPVYRELGPERGWRLAFNLARAYDAIGDTTRAVERYESFLAQVEARRGKDEALEPLIVREERETRERVKEIVATKARILLPSKGAPIGVRVDGSEARLAGFTAYVAPGRHVVVFAPGTDREWKRTVEVGPGEQVEVEPLPAESLAPMRMATVERPVATMTVHERPFPASVLWIAGSVTLASTIVPVLTYLRATDFQSTNKLAGDTDPLSVQGNGRLLSDYDAKKTTYYATLAIPITLAVATGALTSWYFLGTRTREVPLLTFSPQGVFAGVSRRF